MSRTLIPVLIAFLVGAFVVGLSGQSSLSISPAGTLAQCGLSATGELRICNVANDTANPTGAYISANGAPYFLVSSAAVAGVTSFKGRTGTVVPATGDYRYDMLSAPPTKISCTTASLTAGSAGKFDGSGCTIN